MGFRDGGPGSMSRAPDESGRRRFIAHSPLRANPVSYGCLGMCSDQSSSEKRPALKPRMRVKGYRSCSLIP